MILMEKLVEGTILYIYGLDERKNYGWSERQKGKVGVVMRSDDKFKYYTIFSLPENVCLQDKVLFSVVQSRYGHMYAKFLMPGGNEPDTAMRRNEPDTVARRNEPDTVVRRNEPDTVVRRNEPDTVVRRNGPDTVVRRNEPDTAVRRNEPDTAARCNGPDTAVFRNGPDAPASRDDPHIVREKQDIKNRIIARKYGKEFLDKIAPIINCKLKETPKTYEEINRNRHIKAIELIDETDEHDKCYAALIPQRTPFFTSIFIKNPKSKTCYDPSYTITLGLEDYNYLKGKYLDRGEKCLIYFWVHWNKKKSERVTFQGEKIEVTPFEGVWVADFAKIVAYIKKYNLPLKKYTNSKTVGDNVISNYIFDLRDPEIFTQLLWKR
ncbi:hypothetical protein [Dialister succinatiphilus]|uniref:Uncharacterized protein n=1 Tax=Dialister succinatiphilus YIT 11850 TaxID=742743 RepID=H1D2P8_9FIRM|nr:hypothetical protein [Dialister succinatiphilus]EHO62168.1 hypothetical protein HMPREF9453_01886 [Dialister succinatiphilus YIT 11850]